MIEVTIRTDNGMGESALKKRTLSEEEARAIGEAICEIIEHGRSKVVFRNPVSIRVKSKLVASNVIPIISL